MKSENSCTWRVVVASCCVAVLAPGATPRETSIRHDEPTEIIYARVPESARGKLNPLTADPDATRAGKKLFRLHCAECHGEDALGTKRGPTLRVEAVQNAKAGELFWILTNGVVRHGMPAWSKLPEAQRWQIVTFLQSGVQSE